MNDLAITLLTEMQIKEHFEGKETYYRISKEELISFCIKLIKTIERCENE